MRKTEHNRAVWVSKDKASVCYFCLTVGLHVCDKRERPLPMFAQRMLSKYAPCFCTVCVWSVYAFQHSNNAVTCEGLCECLRIVLSESLDALLACLRVGCFLLFGLFFYHSSLPLTYTHNQRDEGTGGVHKEGAVNGRGVSSFSFSSFFVL